MLFIIVVLGVVFKHHAQFGPLNLDVAIFASSPFSVCQVYREQHDEVATRSLKPETNMIPIVVQIFLWNHDLDGLMWMCPPLQTKPVQHFATSFGPDVLQHMQELLFHVFTKQ